MRQISLLLALVLVPSAAGANGWPHTIVRGAGAAVYAQPGETSPVLTRLDPYEPLQLVEVAGEWCRVQVAGVRDHGWARARELVISAGVNGFSALPPDEVLRHLDTEIPAEPDAVVRSWLRFFAGYAHWAAGRRATALEAFEQVTTTPHRLLASLAVVAQATLYADAGDLEASIAAYERLLTNVPGYRLPVDYPHRMVETYPHQFASRLRGSPDIAERVRILRAVAAARREADRLDQTADADGEDRARAWLQLARLEEERLVIDPVLPRREGGGSPEIRGQYERVLERAPTGEAAGHAIFTLIGLEAPYEWEGDWAGRSRWEIDRYSGFLSGFADHAMAGEALFHLAMATWASGGYPEAYSLVIVGTREELEPARTRLSAWFSVMGFMIDPNVRPMRDPARAREAVRLLQQVVGRHALTPSAATAQYYLAVLYDYVFGDGASALPHYAAFAASPATDTRLVTMARERVRVLGAQ